MQVHVPDPRYTDSAQARANFRRAIVVAVGFVVGLWLIEYVNWGLDLRLAHFGVRPGELAGLVGIVFAPLLHAGFGHLITNSLPLLVLGVTMLHLYPRAARVVLPMVYFGPGIAVWLWGPDGTVHVGASGIVYGLVAYVLVAGLIRRDRRAIAASLLVCFLYGTAVWGVLPIRLGVSWQTHLAAAWIGVVLAVVLRHMDVLQPRRYSWEGEHEAPEAGEAGADTARDLH